MTFFQDLYLGDKVSSKKNQIMKKLNNEKAVLDLFLIVLANHPDNMLEIIPQKEILQKGYPDIDFKVVGLAKGKKEAFAVIQHIIEDAITQTGNADVRPYLKQRWEEQV